MNEEITADNYTHLLSCKHCFGKYEKRYFMRCHVLKEMKDGRLKVLVFGQLFHNTFNDESRIRYVDRSRVYLRPDND